MVRAHPTVPSVKPKSQQSRSKRGLRFPGRVETGHSVLLANPPPFTHNSRKAVLGGIRDGCPVQDVSVRLDAGDGALGLDVACGKPCLYPRAGAGVQRRCASPLRRGCSGCRAHHGLYDQEQIAAQPGLPGVLQTRARACGQPRRRWKAAQHQAGNLAKAGQRQAAKVQGRGLTRPRLALPAFNSRDDAPHSPPKAAGE